MWKNWRGEELKNEVLEASRMSVLDTCYIILEAAKQQVPHNEGTLMRSGIAVIDDVMPVGLVSFGGGPGTGHPIVPYAIRWHENNANFQKGRKMKYLEDPFNKLAGRTLIKALRQRLKEVLV